MNRSQSKKLFRRLTLFLKPETFKKLKIACANEDITMSEYVEKLIERENGKLNK